MEIKEQIQEIIKTRNITQLIHFTKKKNIQSIKYVVKKLFKATYFNS